LGAVELIRHRGRHVHFGGLQAVAKAQGQHARHGWSVLEQPASAHWPAAATKRWSARRKVLKHHLSQQALRIPKDQQRRRGFKGSFQINPDLSPKKKTWAILQSLPLNGHQGGRDDIEYCAWRAGPTISSTTTAFACVHSLWGAKWLRSIVKKPDRRKYLNILKPVTLVSCS